MAELKKCWNNKQLCRLAPRTTSTHAHIHTHAWKIKPLWIISPRHILERHYPLLNQAKEREIRRTRESGLNIVYISSYLHRFGLLCLVRNWESVSWNNNTYLPRKGSSLKLALSAFLYLLGSGGGNNLPTTPSYQTDLENLVMC